jgi:alkanesulfonate monooxygenase SsuD/methylene tetrahydromethanopterin reductase-like flavin-dependent oxidoreductase (luciferase family)
VESWRVGLGEATPITFERRAAGKQPSAPAASKSAKGFCIPPEEAQARFDEALEIILKAWTTRERFSHEGRCWRFKNVAVEPPPMQAPHPPLWTGAGSPASIKRAAQRGHNHILDQFASTAMLGERIAL